MARNPKPPPAPRFYAARGYVAGDSVGYLLNQVVLSMRRELEQRMAAHGLTAAQWYPLWRLKIGQPGSARELARDIGVDAGAMTRMIDRLVAKGLVLRRRGGGDRRVVQLALTAAGRRVAARLPAAMAAINNAYLRGFEPAEWLQLKSLLRRMLANGGGALAAEGAGAATAAAAAGRGAGSNTRRRVEPARPGARSPVAPARQDTRAAAGRRA